MGLKFFALKVNYNSVRCVRLPSVRHEGDNVWQKLQNPFAFSVCQSEFKSTEKPAKKYFGFIYVKSLDYRQHVKHQASSDFCATLYVVYIQNYPLTNNRGGSNVNDSGLYSGSAWFESLPEG